MIKSLNENALEFAQNEVSGKILTALILNCKPEDT